VFLALTLHLLVDTLADGENTASLIDTTFGMED